MMTMRFSAAAKASVLALSIAAATATGMSATRSGIDVYQRAVEFSQAHWDKTPALKPSSITPDDQLLSAGTYIYAWVLGPESLLNRLFPQRISSLDAIRADTDCYVRIPSDHDDEQVVTLAFKMPDSPWDARALIDTIRRYSIFYTIDVGTGFIEIPFLFAGNVGP